MVHPCPGLVEPAGEGVRKKAALLRAALAVIEYRDAETFRLAAVRSLRGADMRRHTLIVWRRRAQWPWCRSQAAGQAPG